MHAGFVREHLVESDYRRLKEVRLSTTSKPNARTVIKHKRRTDTNRDLARN
jgi:hypothetical protein